MKGQVLYFDTKAHTGIIRNATGERYNFQLDDWKSEATPVQGLEVDFIANGNEASQIFVTHADKPVVPPVHAPIQQHVTPVSQNTGKQTMHVFIGLLIAALLAAMYLIFSLNNNQKTKEASVTAPTESVVTPAQPAVVTAKPIEATPMPTVPVAPVQGAVPAVTTQSVRTAYVYDPPSNVRTSPTGPILCVLSQRTNINVYGYAGVTWDNSRKVTWYSTDACGPMGVIAYSQIR